MAAPSDPLSQLRVGTDAELSRYDARSHLSDGRVVAWTGPAGGVAIDAEIERPVPPALAARHGEAGFWERWTRLECLAKLTGTPVVVLQRAGLDGGLDTGLDTDPGSEVELVTGRLRPDPATTVVVSVARRRGGV